MNAAQPIDKQKPKKNKSLEPTQVKAQSEQIEQFGLILLIFFIGVLIGCSFKQNNALLAAEPFFMPSEWQGCTKQIYQDIKMAKETICIASYWFTHLNIILALRKARKRNVSVEIIFDKSTPNENTLKIQLQSSGIKFIESDIDAARMHHKFIVIDNSITWLGSANLTGTAFHKNYENILRIKSTEIARRYRIAFNNLTRIFSTSVGPVQQKHHSMTTARSIEDNPLLRPISDYQKKFLDDFGINSHGHNYDTAYALIDKIINSAWRLFIKGNIKK